ncbi:hypothetical protein ACIA5C_08420 [Actinoplanes sp. NPDC051343]|uniref:hypothetical protein n=1 Tax=Actinoplanes sp. NPDC051343 TaxID=3363906 RepID=UPI00379DE87C
MFGDVDQELRRLADDSDFPHRDTARVAQRFRAGGRAADLVAIVDDPHACAMTDVLFAMAGAQRPWLNWVPMPSEAITNMADEFGSRIARGEELRLGQAGLSAAEPPSAIAAARRVAGDFEVGIGAFPAPDIRVPLRRGDYRIWRYDGTDPVAAVAAPSPEAVRVLHAVADQPWASPLSGRIQAEPLGDLPMDDLLGMLAHLPGPPDTERYRFLAVDSPTYWYRFLQPWVCLGILRHREQEPWATSTRRRVLVDLAFGAEDWTSDAALFALVTAAYHDPARRREVHDLVRARLDAALASHRLVTIEVSLARLMLITPGCTADDRAVAAAAIARAATDDEEPAPAPPPKRRWWRRSH